MDDVQALVCGGGPAGLAAGVWLGRYRRKTLIIDGARQRNLPARASHGYLTRDGCAPGEFLDAARAEAAGYETVDLLEGEVTSIVRHGEHFVATAGDGEIRAKRVLLALGVEDVKPDIPGFEELYGRAVFHCSCCDGFETRGMKVLAIGWGQHVAGYALDLLDWGAEVTLVTNGEEIEADEAARAALARHDIELVQERVEELLVDGDDMRGARVSSGRILEAERAFFSIEHKPQTRIATAIGCEVDEMGYVKVGEHGETSVEGVYAAGDMTPGEQLVQVAAAEGAIAGIACAMSLRGDRAPEGTPDPGPDPEAELEPRA